MTSHGPFTDDPLQRTASCIAAVAPVGRKQRARRRPFEKALRFPAPVRLRRRNDIRMNRLNALSPNQLAHSRGARLYKRKS
jgi:hypothetical protein